MKKYLGGWSEHAYAVLRIVAGFLFACHGAQKVFGFLGGPGLANLSALFVVAGLIELVGGILIMVGFLTSWAGFIASGEMAAAYFTAHQSRGALPIQNHGELAVLFSFLFLFIATRGAGIWSVSKSLLPRKGMD